MRRFRRRLPKRAFVLLEVMVSLAILGIALSMLLRSFTVSLRAARLSENTTMACAAARMLVEKWELQPPPPGESEGRIEQDERMTYRVQYQPRAPEYDRVPDLDDGRLAWFRPLSLDIYIERNGRKRRVLHVDSALTGAQRFTVDAMKDNRIGFNQ